MANLTEGDIAATLACYNSSGMYIKDGPASGTLITIFTIPSSVSIMTTMPGRCLVGWIPMAMSKDHYAAFAYGFVLPFLVLGQ